MAFLQGILKALIMGVIDSLKGSVTLFYLDRNIQESVDQQSPRRRTRNVGTPNRRLSHAAQTLRRQEEPKVLRRTWQCCLLNGGVFWLSIVVFQYILLLLKYALYLMLDHNPNVGLSVWGWMELVLQWTFGALWILPLFLLSKVVNALWFQDIADSAYRYSRGTPQQFSSVSKLVADTLFSIVVQALFLVQTMLVSLLPIPVLADLMSLVHMCLLYSLYSFEYKWCNMGWELHRRITYIENNWPYFVGFGLPMAVFTNLSQNFFISGCMFSMLFPLFIISGNEANPVTDVCDSRLKLFSPVITISNALFNRAIGFR
uniref:Etoposide-induced protein 2.4 homolog n=1 Tax=Homalodisca liturata TaxID=320908 RepID=A0A1B6IYD0_9HEMI